MKKTVFSGMATALVTPITPDGVDYDALGRLIDWQIDEGINGLVVCGTTGEASTLTDDEHKAVIKYSVERSAGRVPVIAGTGSNDTEYAIELTKYAGEVGSDGVLLVTPYYNKATQNGLIKMFSQLADISAAPVILYNVPSRTGINIAPKTVKALSEHPNICGIKEAGGDISAIAQTIALCGDSIDVYSGNDDQVVPIMSLGGKGCISVLSNLLPKASAEMCAKFFSGDVSGAAKMQLELIPLINALFSEVNPIPVKAAMAAMGYCENHLRLPLTPMEDANYRLLIEEMKKQGITVN